MIKCFDPAEDTSTKCERCGGNRWVAKRNSLLGPGLYEVDCDPREDFAEYTLEAEKHQ